jgi:hypothetical protein
VYSQSAIGGLRMASWMVHFRIGDKLIDNIAELQIEPYIVGNIGPDCGEPNEDWSVFTPSSDITHWAPNGKKAFCNYEKFYNTYIKHNGTSNCNLEFGNVSNENSIDKWSFYLGYYIHLITDVLWVKEIARPTMEQWNEEFAKDSNFIWQVKEDWYDLDHLYLKKNPDFRAFQIFKDIKNFDNCYLDYYSEKAFMKQIEYISRFYLDSHVKLEREYPYLTEKRMNEFVDYAIEFIMNEMREKNIIN